MLPAFPIKWRAGSFLALKTDKKNHCIDPSTVKNQNLW